MSDKITPDKLTFLLVGTLVGLLIGMFIPGGSILQETFLSQKDQITRKVVDTYRIANPGSDIEVINIQETDGLYKIFLKTGPGSYQTVWVSKNGRLLTENMAKLQNLRERLKNRKDFLSCLKDRGVKIYGALKTNNTQIQRTTRLQIQLLGGMDFLDEIYQDCSDDLQACVQQGVTTLPSVKYKEEFYGGVKQYQWFEENVNCSVE